MKGELGLHNNDLQDVTAAVAKNRRKSTWKRIVSVLACIVVFCTTYALILPALTLEKDAECGLEEHTHTEACYIRDDSSAPEVLVCTAETLGLHVHTDACIGIDGEYICGYSDFVIHSHNEYCYDESGMLVCTLPEIFPHIHTDSCYLMTEDAGAELNGGFDGVSDNSIDNVSGHIHTDECYVNELGELICTLPTEAAHVHTDECYLTTNQLTCPLPEGEGHIHGEGCFDEAGALVCTVPESAGHTHTPECYTASSELICTIAEGEQIHVHTDECYAQSKVLVCDIEEGTAEPSDDGTALPSFEDGAFNAGDQQDGWVAEPSFENNTISDRGEPICGMTEIIPHCHDDSCFDANGMLICGMTEVLEHIHTQECMGKQDDSDELTCTIAEGDGAHIHTVEGGCFDEEGTLICELEESEGHVHSAICYGNWTLVCGIEEHTHTEECYSSDEPAADPARIAYCGKEEHTHAGDCINDNGVVVCLIEEHKHGEECYIDTSAEPETFCGKIEHIHADECFDENGLLVCTIEEHLHGEECYVASEELLPVPGEVYAVAELVECDGIGFNTMMLSDLPMRTMSGAREIIYDFGSNIDSASVLYQDETGWHNLVNSGHKVVEGEKLQFTIGYNLPGNKISKDSPAITYKLKENIRINEECSGSVMSKDLQHKVGSYTIKQDGTITITFYEEYAQKNASGQSIDGSITFSGNLNNIIVSGDNKTISITESVIIGPVDILPPDNSDINVVKDGSTSVNENGEIEYTVTISSQNGTTHPVKVTDWMENVSLVNGVSGITITDPNGVVSPDITQTSNGFEFELPKMSPATSYIITYKCKLPDGYDQSKVDIGTNNTLKAETEKKNGHNTSWQDDHRVTYTQQYLGKTGTKTDDGKILWTITVNAGKQNIGGWTLYDNFNGSTPEGPFTMTDSSGNVTKITLPHTFATDSNDTYTITYTTDAEASPGTNIAKNQVNLKDPDDSSDNPKVNVEITVDKTFEPVEKIGSPDIVIDSDSGDAILEWTVNISGPIYGNWKYEDYLTSDYQGTTYLTEQQYQEVISELNKTGIAYTIEPYTWGNGDNTIRGFIVNFAQTLGREDKIIFTYHSTGKLDGGRSDKLFQNEGKVNGNGGRKATIKYSPLIQKHDTNARNQAETSHMYKDINGLIKWEIKFKAPENLKSDLVITEHLPNGINLTSFKFTIWDALWGVQLLQNNSFSDIQVNVWSSNYNIKCEKTGNDVKITIPHELLNAFVEKDKIFEIEAKIDEKFLEVDPNNEEVYVGIFNNSVDIGTSDGKNLGTTSQIQTITKDDSKPPLKKEHGTISDNIIPYVLKINPNGKDLLQNSDTLTLVDKLTVLDNSYEYSEYMLVSGSLKIYKLNQDGTRGEQYPSEQFPYTYDVVMDRSDPSNPKHIYTIRMDVPDETPLQVEYNYVAYPDEDHMNRWPKITNSAELQGVQPTGSDNETLAEFQLQESMADAGTQSITISKYDKDNYGARLGGAKFNLYKYDNASGKYVIVTDETTNQPIVIETKAEDGGKAEASIILNNAYYLVEIEAPTGYILDPTPRYFVVQDKDYNKYPNHIPNDFDGTYLTHGQPLTIPNTSTTTSLKVRKLWKDDKGNAYEPTVDNIQFNLYRQIIGADGVKLAEEPYPGNETIGYGAITIGKSTDWMITLDNLEKYGKYEDKDVTYKYYVDEINTTPDINVTYSDDQTGVVSGTITITNTVDTAPKHELPSTGGGGKTKFLSAGAGLMLIALLALLRKPKISAGGVQILLNDSAPFVREKILASGKKAEPK